jgi:hypothetical protein
MKRAGAHVRAASLIHWPGQPSQVVDEFVLPTAADLFLVRARRLRRGSF